MEAKSVSLFIDVCIEVLKIVKKSVDERDINFIKDMNVMMPILREIMMSTQNRNLSEEVLFNLISAIELIYNDGFISKYKYKKIIGMISEFINEIN